MMRCTRPDSLRLRLAASGGVFLALTGAWLGHEFEYLRVWGVAGLERGLVGSMHAYMLPVGLVFAGLAALFAGGAWIRWQQLALRLDRAALAFRAALSGKRVTLEPVVRDFIRPSWGSRILVLGAALAILQIGLYLLQENVEALIVGATAPGFGAITGVHWAAPLIQLDIALTLLTAVAFVQNRLQARAAAIASLELFVRAIIGRLRVVDDVPRRFIASLAPHRFWGRHIWSRPPPLPVIAA